MNLDVFTLRFICVFFYHDFVRIELFNGKGGLVKGCIESIDRTGADVVALENPKLVSTNTTQWHVFAAFGGSR